MKKKKTTKKRIIITVIAMAIVVLTGLLLNVKGYAAEPKFYILEETASQDIVNHWSGNSSNSTCPYCGNQIRQLSMSKDVWFDKMPQYDDSDSYRRPAVLVGYYSNGKSDSMGTAYFMTIFNSGNIDEDGYCANEANAQNPTNSYNWGYDHYFTQTEVYIYWHVNHNSSIFGMYPNEYFLLKGETYESVLYSLGGLNRRFNHTSNDVPGRMLSLADYMFIDNVKNLYQSGWDEGYEYGERMGNAQGYGSGFDVGYNYGKSEGLNEGYENGYNIGYPEGEQNGYDNGYYIGYEFGYDYGYTNGFKQAYIDSDVILDNGSAFLNMIFSAVAEFLITIGSLELLGIKLWTLIALPIIFGVALMIIKTIRG